MVLELLFFALFAIYIIFLIYSSIKGSPYVPSSKKEIAYILDHANLKKNQVFLDLGCGDGRVVRYAVKKFQTKGIGVDINMFLILLAKLFTKINHINNIEFLHLDIVKDSLPTADVIYIFLMPKLIKSISPKLKKQLLDGALIISHGFKIEDLSKYLKEEIDHQPFPTYFYKLTSLI